MDRGGRSRNGVRDHRGLATGTGRGARGADTTPVRTTVSCRVNTAGFGMDNDVSKRVRVGACMGVPPVVL